MSLVAVADPWRELTEVGLRVDVRGDRGSIRFPADRSCLGLLLAPAAVVTFSAVVLAVLGLDARLIVAVTLLVIAFSVPVAVIKRAWWRPFDVTVDFGTGDVVIPPHVDAVYGGRFNARDVVGVSVDWSRGHGEQAAAGAPIDCLAFSLSAPNPARASSRSAVFCSLSRLSAAQARALAAWSYRYIAPAEAHRFQLDPDPGPWAD